MPLTEEIIAHLGQATTYLAHLYRIEERRREVLANWLTASRTNVYARGGYLKKSNASGDNAGAFASHGLTGNGYVRFLSRLDGRVQCGLSETDADETADTIEYSIRVVPGGTITVYESGVLKATHSATAKEGDWFYIKRIDGAITYWHNRTLIYTSAATTEAELFADASIYTKLATLEQVSYGAIPQTILFTDHTRRITYNSETYTPLPLQPTQFNLQAGLKPDNAEFGHLLSAANFTELELLAGRWDLARIEVITVNYQDMTQGHARKKVGYIGEVRTDNGAFTAEIRGLSQLLSQDLGDTIGSLCRVKRLGDFECGLDITDYLHDAEIVSAHAPVVSPLVGNVNLSAVNPNIPVGDSTYFPDSGLIIIDFEEIFYTGKTIIVDDHFLIGATRGVNGTTATTHVLGTPVSSFHQFEVDLSPAKANDYFKQGSAFFRNGLNKYYERETKLNFGNVVILHRPFPFLPDIGDLVTLVAGCDRRRETCMTFPNADEPTGTNVENFQGEPDTPGAEKVIKYPV